MTRRYPSPAAGAVGRARELRRDQTQTERVLWRHLREARLAGYVFRRQYPIGPYVLDFFCFKHALAIELDGGQHAEPVRRDAERTAWLESHGVRVIRVWDNEVLQNIEGVTEAIWVALQASPNNG